MKTRVPWLKRLAAFLLALAILLPMSPGLPAHAVTQAEIDALKGSASQLDKEKKDLQNQLKEIRADKSKAQEQKNLLERQINVIEAEIDNIESQIAGYDQLIAQKEDEVAGTQAEEAAQYDLFCKRVRYMEEEGEVSYWSILFGSSDFTDLLDNFMMVEEIIEYDNRVMENLIAIRQRLETEQADLEQSRQEQADAKAQQEAKQAELEAQQKEVDVLIGQISSKEDELEAAEAKLRAAADAMDKEIARKEKELAAQLAMVPSESGFLWPLPAGYNTLSSLFGNRIHPLTGRPNNHTGIDIPAAGGTKIYAAKSGIVSTSAYHSSYGNYVVVSHSDGTSTLYAHMKKRAVSEGQTVKQGDVVGYVGTTGSSTGNHLHFEIRVSGARKDPVDYFKDKTLYVTYKGQKELLKH